MPAARGAATVGEPSSQHPAQAPLAPGDRREATTRAAARASLERGPAARGRRAPRFSPARRWSRLPCDRPTRRRLIPKESHKPGLDRCEVIGIHLLLATTALLKKTRPPTISCLEWASRPPHGAATSGAFYAGCGGTVHGQRKNPSGPPGRGREVPGLGPVIDNLGWENSLRGESGPGPGSSHGHYPTRITNSSFGPWAPRTRIRSMSPVRLGPVMKESMLGSALP